MSYHSCLGEAREISVSSKSGTMEVPMRKGGDGQRIWEFLNIHTA